MTQRLDHLDDPGDAGGGLCVPDVRLHRTQPQRLVRRALPAVGGEQCLRLDRVAQPGAGPVRLHHVDVRRREPGVDQRRLDHPLLRRPVRGGQPVGRAVLVDSAAAYHGEDRMPVALGLGQPLQQQHTGALGEAGAVGGTGEGLATAVGGQAALTGEADEQRRGRHHCHTAGQRERALTGPQRLRRQVQRDQRRRAGRVDGDRRPLQAQRVRHPAGDHRTRVAGGEVALQALGRTHQHGRVVRAVGAREHAGRRPGQRRRVDAGPLDGLPRHLQQEPLRRVHRQCLARADAEEAGVEVTRPAEEPALGGVRRPGVVRVGVEQRLGVPAPVGRERRDAVPVRRDQVPQ